MLDALVFDAYGTLFDVHSVAALAERLVPGRGRELSQRWRAKQLEYSWLSSLMHEPPMHADFAAVTEQALDYAAEVLGITLGSEARAGLLGAYLHLDPFADATETLAALAPRPRWILSNGSRAMLAPLVERSTLAAHLDGLLTVEPAGIFKPSPRVYQLAADALRLPPQRIGFVSSNCWDAIGAGAFGFVAFWVNRANAPVDRHGPAPDRVLRTLTELPQAVANWR